MKVLVGDKSKEMLLREVQILAKCVKNVTKFFLLGFSVLVETEETETEREREWEYASLLSLSLSLSLSPSLSPSLSNLLPHHAPQELT